MKGNYSDFETLVDKYQGMVFSQGLKFTKNQEEAEDLTQEVFLKAFESLSTFRGESQFSTWLFRIAQNLALNGQRKSKALPIDFPEDMDKVTELQHHTSPESLVLEKESHQKLYSMLSKLPLNYKNPLVLYYFENMSYGEIAEKLNLKMNTLKSYILRGKETLKRYLQNENKD